MPLASLPPGPESYRASPPANFRILLPSQVLESPTQTGLWFIVIIPQRCSKQEAQLWLSFLQLSYFFLLQLRCLFFPLPGLPRLLFSSGPRQLPLFVREPMLIPAAECKGCLLVGLIPILGW